MEIEILAEKLIQGNSDAFEAIVDRFTPLVSTIVYNLANGALSVPDMEDITSDTFITLWYNREKVQPDKLKGYI